MTQILALFLVLILAALYPDNLATIPSPVDNTSNAESAIHFPTEEPNIVKNQSSLEKHINKKFINLQFRSFDIDQFVEPLKSQRINTTDEILCITRKRLVNPRSPEDSRYSWITVQSISGKPAGILIEECANPGQSCGQYFSLTVPKGVTATCEDASLYGYWTRKSSVPAWSGTFGIPYYIKGGKEFDEPNFRALFPLNQVVCHEWARSILTCKAITNKEFN